MIQYINSGLLRWYRLNPLYIRKSVSTVKTCLFQHLALLHTTCVFIISQPSFLPHNRPTLQHIVDEEAILQLMKTCRMCTRKCRCSKRTRSPYLIVYQSCYFCHYQRKWASQPKGRIMNIYKKAHNLPKSKHKPGDKLSVNTKAQWCQLNKTSISESSVSKPDGISEDPQYQLT